MNTYKDSYLQWCQQVQDAVLQRELQAIAQDENEIYERFYQPLSFGTAGLRGILGAGTQRMNRYTVAQATQGFARYLKDTYENPSVAIGYDSRNMSSVFAEITACVFAGNGISVFLFPQLAPTPVLSYAIRHLHCSGGVVITASHNPAEYNGYKAYNHEGCQIDESTAKEILSQISQTHLFQGITSIPLSEGLANGSIHYVDPSLCESYLEEISQHVLQKEICKTTPLRVVYTPLHGAGLSWVTQALRRQGISDLHIVSSQEHPDGNFPTCPYPNPEFPEALEEGLKVCHAVEGEILLATDPDSDRLGTMVLHQGAYHLLTGNQVGELLLDYICQAHLLQGSMPSHPVMIKSVVSSKLADAIAKSYGVATCTVLTGFKHVGGALLQLEQENRLSDFLFAFEESCGYLSTTLCRDKDAVDACSRFAEMAAFHKSQGHTLVDVLEILSQRHGYFLSQSVSFAYAGSKGQKTMDSLMEQLRTAPPTAWGGYAITHCTDYLKHDSLTTNMLEFSLGEDLHVLVRPSGTEPKIKFYLSVRQDSPQQRDSVYENLVTDIRRMYGNITF